MHRAFVRAQLLFRVVAADRRHLAVAARRQLALRGDGEAALPHPVVVPELVLGDGVRCHVQHLCGLSLLVQTGAEPAVVTHRPEPGRAQPGIGYRCALTGSQIVDRHLAGSVERYVGTVTLASIQALEG